MDTNNHSSILGFPPVWCACLWMICRGFGFTGSGKLQGRVNWNCRHWWVGLIMDFHLIAKADLEEQLATCIAQPRCA
jgi:hypothetical protein